MIEKRKTSDNSIIIRGAAAVTKSKIVAEGIKLLDLAAAAHMAPSTLSDYIGGRLTNIHRRFDIYCAFCRLAGRRVTTPEFAEFWGLIHARGVA